MTPPSPLRPRDLPPFADFLWGRLGGTGKLLAESVTTVADENNSDSEEIDAPLAWAGAFVAPGGVRVAAVAEIAPETIVVIDGAAADAPGLMAMARSLVLRSNERVAAGGLCSTEFDDLEAVPLEIRAPQFAIEAPGELGFAHALACTWPEMALEPGARVAAARTRSSAKRETPDGRSGPVLEPFPAALDGIFRSLRKGKEPLLSNAALTAQALLTRDGGGDDLRARIGAWALTEGLTAERAEILGALVDTLNGVILKEQAATGRPSGTPKVVLFTLRLPKEAGGDVTGYFFDGDHAAKVKLERRHPETPLAASTVDAGFAGLTAIFRKHRAVIQRALGVEGGFELRRGFHADLTLAAMAASFETDGFVAVPLVFDR
jgi:hypothetical protein